MYTTENWQEMIDAMQSGTAIEIGEDVFDYFLGVLPPVYMGARRVVGNGADRQERRVSFGFAEGYEPVTAFWSDAGKYFCQRTEEMNHG